MLKTLFPCRGYIKEEEKMKKFMAIMLSAALLAASGSMATECLADSYGYSYSYDPHNLADFGYRTVRTGGRGSLVFQYEPGGAAISGYSYNDGDSIYVNLNWREKGYALAYQAGVYGFVDASYIEWYGNTSWSGHANAANPYNLSNYGYRQVVTGGRGSLVFQTEPGGAAILGHSYNDGDWIYVNLSYSSSGYTMAYDNGTYGYVDAGYINWYSGSTSSSAINDPYNLSNFAYRAVATGGRGNLVFQTSPGGSFLNSHSFGDGSWIYVNTSWRSSGYAMAYDNGTYGYVDAAYIDWTSGAYSGGSSSDPYSLSNFGYRAVATGGQGNLVFQTSPGGSFMNSHSFGDGSYIYVNLTWRSQGYALAYDNGTYGYVDAGYIDWYSGSSKNTYYDPFNLSNFAYRPVTTLGRGNVVFQISPGGSFLNGYSFGDGDWLYVNLNWRSQGYAIAYRDGTYGYIDASYIGW